MEIHYYSLAHLQIRLTCATAACTDLRTSTLLLVPSSGSRWSDCRHKVLYNFLRAQVLELWDYTLLQRLTQNLETIRDTTKAKSSI